MRDLQGKRIAVYARYSTDRQNVASIADQVRVCREYAARRAGAVDEALIFKDRAISGTSAARPGLQNLLETVRSGLIDVVLTEDLSRIGRNVGNNDRFFSDMQESGARLIAINDGFDTGERKSRMLGAIKSAMAADYIDELKDRTKRGMDGLFMAGMSTGGKTYGYHSVPAADGTDRKRLVIEEAQAKVVLRIFTLYAEGLSQNRIAKALNTDGIPSPRGGKWGHLTIRAMVQNEVYSGVVVFNRRAWWRDPQSGKRRKVERPSSEWQCREEPSLRIVPEELWQQTRDRVQRDAKTYTQGKRPKKTHPLSGLLQCALCGSQMIIAGNSRYYRCSSAQKGHGCENRRSLPERAIRTWLLDKIIEVAGEAELLREIRAGLAQAIGTHHRNLKHELAERQTSLTNVKRRLSKVIDLIVDGDNSVAMREKRAELEEQAELLRQVARRLEAQLNQVLELPTAEQLQAFLKGLPELVLRKPQEAKELLSLMLTGPLECTPPDKKGGDYTIGFQLSSDWVITTNSRLVGREFASGGCGDRI